MEFRTLSLESLIEAARANLIETYIGLADSVPGTHRITSPHFQGVLAMNPFAFCNFVIGLHGDCISIKSGVRELVQLAYRQPVLRVFTVTGDSPGTWVSALGEAGFRGLNHLVQMVWHPDGALKSTVNPSSCVSPEDRSDVSQFMVDQFFAINEPRFRATVKQATQESRNQLFAVRERGSIVGAVMVSEDANCVGLYNLCVHPRARARGLGSGIVAAIQSHAAEQSKPVILQCDSKLVRWYGKRGFAEFGEIQSFHHRF